MAPTLTAKFPLLLAALLLSLAAGCVYRVDVQQGNLLEAKDLEAIRPGMTRNQVRFILGTPLAGDPFRSDRWDYMYYVKPGKSRKPTQRWVIVWFDGDKVREVTKDVPVGKKG
jgi:outer membrane protein assembly factor BamE